MLFRSDEQDIREGSQRILSRMGFEVHLASRGDEALEKLADTQAAIMLLDLKMPGMDGLEVLARVGKMNADVLVIVITGYATVETAIEAMKQGAYDFIPKPFEPDQLDRKSTRLNSSHANISYAVFCLEIYTLSLHDALPI